MRDHIQKENFLIYTITIAPKDTTISSSILPLVKVVKGSLVTIKESISMENSGGETINCFVTPEQDINKVIAAKYLKTPRVFLQFYLVQSAVW